MKKTIEKIERLNLVLIGAGAFVGGVTGLLHVPSFLLGGGVMHVNFWLLRKLVRSVFSQSQARSGTKMQAALWFSAKGLLFLLLLSAVFFRYPIQAQSFAAGVPLLLIACVLISLFESKSEEDPPPSAQAE